MKAFNYNLEKLLDIKNIEKDITMGELAEVNLKLSNEKDSLLDIIIKINKNCEDYNAKIKSNPSVAQILNIQHYVNFLESLKAKQIERIEELEAEAEICLENLILAKIEVGKLEKHKERVKNVWHEDIKKEEILNNDERANVLHYMKRLNNEDKRN